MTRRNRRNYYRILHVQPDAPAEIIKASYRTLMSKLRMHPDLGGDHELALLVNEAYAVIGDPERRAAYDREYGGFPRRNAFRASGAQWHAPPRQNDRDARAHDGETGAADTGTTEVSEHCHWCNAASPPTIRPDTRCTRCNAPLADPPEPGAREHELFGRRSTSRHPRANLAIMQRRDGGMTMSVRLRDISFSGLGMMTTTAVPDGTVVRIQAQEFEAVAVIIDSRREGSEHLLHARLLSLVLQRRGGVFVSETA